jgi:hypothetical protein
MGIIKYDKDLDAYTLITNYQVSKGKLYSELTGKITYLRQPSVKTSLNKTFVKTFKEDMDGVYWNNYH